MSNGHLKVHEQCQMQAAWGETWTKNKAYDKHIEEGEGKGGHRDRLAKLEVQMKIILSSGKWFVIAACIGGFLGGIVGKVAPEITDAIIKTIFK